MTTLPRIDVGQAQIPGTDGAEVKLTLHAVTEHNYSQRITIARRCRIDTRYGFTWSKWRNHDVVLTRAQILDLIDQLIDRIDVIHDDIPEVAHD